MTNIIIVLLIKALLRNIPVKYDRELWQNTITAMQVRRGWWPPIVILVMVMMIMMIILITFTDHFPCSEWRKSRTSGRLITSSKG